MAKINDVRLKIIQHLQEADKPLIAHHISKGIDKTPQLTSYHLKCLVEQGVILTQEEYGHTYYFLQPNFYLEDAELTLMEILIPWIKAFSKETEKVNGQTDGKTVLNNLRYYLTLFLKNNIEEVEK